MRAHRGGSRIVTRLRALGATALCAASAFAIGAGSRARFELEASGDAAIRLSWRAVGRPVEQCRTPSAEELAQLPVHMRRSEICERRLSAFLDRHTPSRWASLAFGLLRETCLLSSQPHERETSDESPHSFTPSRAR